MKTLKERIQEGLASIQQASPALSASEQAELARVAAYVNGDTPVATAPTDDKSKTPEPAPAATSAQASAEIVSLQETIRAQGTQIASLQSQQATAQAEAQLTKDSARVDGLVRGMKMTAAEGKTWKELAKSNPVAFAASFGTQESRPVMSSLRGGNSVRAQTEMSGDPGAEMSRLTEARAKEKNIGYGEAAKQIAAERPELAAAHSAQTQVVSVEGDGN